jgi:Gpi16 subunit, GPI transamidase component
MFAGLVQRQVWGLEGGRERVLASDPVLITFPIPDGSMPFNVITLVTELYSLFVQQSLLVFACAEPCITVSCMRKLHAGRI